MILLFNPVADIPFSVPQNEYLNAYSQAKIIATSMNLQIASALCYFVCKNYQVKIYMTSEHLIEFNELKNKVSQELEKIYEGHKKSKLPIDQLNNLSGERLNQLSAINRSEKFQNIDIEPIQLKFLTNSCILMWNAMDARVLIGDYLSEADINEVKEPDKIKYISCTLYKQFGAKQLQVNQISRADLIICQDSFSKGRIEQKTRQLNLQPEILLSNDIKYNMNSFMNKKQILLVINRNIERHTEFYSLIKDVLRNKKPQITFKTFKSVIYSEQKQSMLKDDEIPISDKLDDSQLKEVNFLSVVAQLINFDPQRTSYDRQKDLKDFNIQSGKILILSFQVKVEILKILQNSDVFASDFNFIYKRSGMEQIGLFNQSGCCDYNANNGVNYINGVDAGVGMGYGVNMNDMFGEEADYEGIVGNNGVNKVNREQNGVKDNDIEDDEDGNQYGNQHNGQHSNQQKERVYFVSLECKKQLAKIYKEAMQYIIENYIIKNRRYSDQKQSDQQYSDQQSSQQLNQQLNQQQPTFIPPVFIKRQTSTKYNQNINGQQENLSENYQPQYSTLQILNPFTNQMMKVSKEQREQEAQQKIDNNSYTLYKQEPYETKFKINSQIEIATLESYLNQDSLNPQSMYFNRFFEKKEILGQKAQIQLQNTTINFELQLHEIKSKVCYLNPIESQNMQNEVQVINNLKVKDTEFRGGNDIRSQIESNLGIQNDDNKDKDIKINILNVDNVVSIWQ